MFSCNVLAETQSGHLALYYRDQMLLLDKSGSTLSVVGSTSTYKIRPSGLAVLQKTVEKDEPTSEPPAVERVEPSTPDIADSTETETKTAEVEAVAEPVASQADARTYYIRIAANGELNTEDFGFASNTLWNTKPMPKGTRMAVAVISLSEGCWSVPGTHSLSFLPMMIDKPGNIGDVLVTSRAAWGQAPLWNLECSPTDGYVFYTLLHNLNRPTFVITS